MNFSKDVVNENRQKRASDRTGDCSERVRVVGAEELCGAALRDVVPDARESAPAVAQLPP